MSCQAPANAVASAPAEPRSDDPSRHFSTAHLNHDLKGRSVRGGALTVASYALSFVFRLGSTAVLARILEQQAFGLVAMATVFIGFIKMFLEDASLATVQREEINHDQVSTLFWVNVGLGLAACAFTAAMGPVLAWFYGQPQLVWITAALGGTFIFLGLTVQHQALMRRQMRLKALAFIQVAGMAAAVVAAVVMAWAGTGYWSLVALAEVPFAVNAVLVWSFCRWRPTWPRRVREAGSLLVFGGNSSGSSLLEYGTRYSGDVCIGWFSGAGALGFYTKAYALLLQPLQRINSPLTLSIVPALSRLRDKPEQYRQFYRRVLEGITMLGTPMVFCLGVMADEVVDILLGPGWETSATLFQLLMPAALMSVTDAGIIWVYLTWGHVGRKLRWSIFTLIVTASSILLGLHWGFMGVGVLGAAVAISISQTFLKLPGLVYCFRGTPLSVDDFAHAVWRPTLAAAVCAIGLAEMLPLLEGIGSFPRLLIGGSAFTSVYLAVYCLMPGSLSVRALAQRLKPGRGKA